MIKSLPIALVLATTAIAHAESLEEKKYWQGQQSYLDRSLAEAEKKCDVKFTFEVVDKAKLREEHDKKNHTPYAVCDGMIQRVIILCRAGGEEKAAVKSKITGFQCGHGKPRSLSLDKGIVRYRNNLDEANFDDWAKKALTQRL